MGLMTHLKALLDAAAASVPSLFQGTEAANLDGSAERISLGALFSGMSAGDPFSMGITIKMPATTTNQAFVWGEGASNNGFVQIQTEGTSKPQVGAQIGASSRARRNGSTSLQAGAWYRLAVTTDGTQAGTHVYLNGANDDGTAATASNTAAATDEIDVGAYQRSFFYAIGARDVWFAPSEFSAANIASVDADLAALTDPTATLTGIDASAEYWEIGATGDDLDSTGSPVVQELTGNGSDATPVATEAGDLSAHGLPWQDALSILLDGTNEYIDLGQVMSGRSSTTAMSFSFWVKTGSISNEFILGRDAAGLSPIQAQFDTTNFYAYSGKGYRSTTYTGGSWQHWAITISDFTNAYPTIYRDGTSVGSITPASGSFASTATICIGRANALYINANVRDVVISVDTEWSSGQVATLYNGGAPVDVSGTSVPHDHHYCVGAWNDDATGTTGTIEDLTGTNDGTPYNTEAADLEADAP
jgi:hypothetical protein